MIPTIGPTESAAESPTKSAAISKHNAANASVFDRTAHARETSLKLEASFLSEMLKSAGLGMQTNSFSGSEGEDQFASFQRDAIAEHMVRGGGIGLAEHFFNAMMEAQKDG